MALPLLFHRNQAALLELLDEREKLGDIDKRLIPLGDKIKEFYRVVMLHKWASSEHEWSGFKSEVFEQIRQIHANSGWEALLQRTSQETKQPVVTRGFAFSSPFASSFLARLAFAQGRTLMLFPGSESSADVHKVSRLPHPAIIRGTPYISDRRVHLLVEPIEIIDTLSNFIVTASWEKGGISITLLLDLATQLTDVYVYASMRDYSFALEDTFAVRQGKAVRVMIYPRTSHFLSYRNEDEARDDVRELFRDLVRRNIEFINGDSAAAIKLWNSWIAGAGRLPIQTDHPPAPPEYVLPEIHPSELPRAQQLVSELISYHQSAKIEPLMALLSQGFGPQLDGPGSEINRIYPVFLDNLHHFGYLRTAAIGRDIARDVDLLHYQAYRNDLAAHGQLQGGGYGLHFDVRQPPKIWQPPLRSGQGDKWLDVKRWGLGEEELPLQLSLPREPTITLHGIELDTQELQAVLYNTILGAAIEDGTLDWNPAWLTAADVLLLADLIDGRIMPHVFYTQLSPGAYNSLMTPRSYLDLYDLPAARLELDKAFILGVPPRQQFQASANSFRQATTLTHAISRLAELVT